MAKSVDREKWELILKLAKQGQGVMDKFGRNIISMAIEQNFLTQQELIKFTTYLSRFDYTDKNLVDFNKNILMNTNKDTKIDYIKLKDPETGNLPIHYVLLLNPSYETLIKKLISAYPESLHITNNARMSPLGILNYLCKKASNTPQFEKINNLRDSLLMIYSIQRGTRPFQHVQEKAQIGPSSEMLKRELLKQKLGRKLHGTSTSKRMLMDDLKIVKKELNKI